MRSILALLGIGTACAACCLPFLAPFLVATGLSGILALRVGGVSLDYMVCVAGPWIAVAGGLALVIALVRRGRGKTTCACETLCTPGEC
jgi:hypothetical protein